MQVKINPLQAVKIFSVLLLVLLLFLYPKSYANPSMQQSQTDKSKDGRVRSVVKVIAHAGEAGVSPSVGRGFILTHAVAERELGVRLNTAEAEDEGVLITAGSVIGHRHSLEIEFSNGHKMIQKNPVRYAEHLEATLVAIVVPLKGVPPIEETYPWAESPANLLTNKDEVNEIYFVDIGVTGGEYEVTAERTKFFGEGPTEVLYLECDDQPRRFSGIAEHFGAPVLIYRQNSHAPNAAPEKELVGFLVARDPDSPSLYAVGKESVRQMLLQPDLQPLAERAAGSIGAYYRQWEEEQELLEQMRAHCCRDQCPQAVALFEERTGEEEVSFTNAALQFQYASCCRESISFDSMQPEKIAAALELLEGAEAAFFQAAVHQPTTVAELSDVPLWALCALADNFLLQLRTQRYVVDRLIAASSGKPRPETLNIGGSSQSIAKAEQFNQLIQTAQTLLAEDPSEDDEDLLRAALGIFAALSANTDLVADQMNYFWDRLHAILITQLDSAGIAYNEPTFGIFSSEELDRLQGTLVKELPYSAQNTDKDAHRRLALIIVYFLLDQDQLARNDLVRFKDPRYASSNEVMATRNRIWSQLPRAFVAYVDLLSLNASQ